MSNSTQLLLEWEGQIVPRAFSPGYVALSYLVSYIGAWTTLELINKRTAARGLYNWYLLIGSSISMGGIAIWCMHYIGNRAIVLGHGETTIQIAYNPGFTVLSFFVPIIVLLVAFIAVGSNDTVSIIRVTIGGALAGLAICGMHYLGQASVSNYTCVYQVGNVVGAAVIAVVASITALSVFFILRAAWASSWWKRALTAVILAGAVSGMHWLASVGTQYRLKQVDLTANQNLSAESTVVVVIVLSIAACFILLAFTLLAQRRRSRAANRAQHVVLAVAIFDKDGRLMVTPEGSLPNQKITNSYIQRSFDDVFGISHPVFHWIFRTTRNWRCISSLLPSMRNHLNHTSVIQDSQPGTKGAELSLTDDDGEPIEDYSVIFRELFCIAAADLADQLNEPLENVGVLFDEIFSTGQMFKSKSNSRRNPPQSSVEDGIILPQFGRGQLLFLTRRANIREAERLQAAGFRFATIQNIVDILARSMQIHCDNLTQRLAAMREYTNETHILEPGVHMACFAIRASVHGGFDVLVRNDARNQLPTMQLPIQSLDSWQLNYLSQLDGMSVQTCLKFLRTKATTPLLPENEQIFTTQLHDTIEALRDEIDDPLFQEAVLIAKPVSAPCRSLTEDAHPNQAQLIAFRLMMPIHSRALDQKLEFTPLSFFKMQQHVYKNSPDHAVFARKIHREFGPILNQARESVPGRVGDSKGLIESSLLNGSRLRSASKSNLNVRSQLEHTVPAPMPNTLNRESKRVFRLWERGDRKSRSDGQAEASAMRGMSDSSSEKNLVETQAFGGIMVSQEVTVDVQDMGLASLEPGKIDGEEEGMEMVELRRKSEPVVERVRIGTIGWASKEVEDPETYVDHLFAVCVEKR